jgi:WD40 repeat protein
LLPERIFSDIGDNLDSEEVDCRFTPEIDNNSIKTTLIIKNKILVTCADKHIRFWKLNDIVENFHDRSKELEPIIDLNSSSAPSRNFPTSLKQARSAISALAYHENVEKKEFFLLMGDMHGEISVVSLSMKIPPYMATIESANFISSKSVHSSEILEIANFYSLDMFVSCSTDHSVKLLTLKHGHICQIQTIKTQASEQSLMSSLCFIKSHQYFAYCNDANKMTVWRFKIGKETQRVQMVKYWSKKQLQEDHKSPVKIRSSNDQFDPLFFTISMCRDKSNESDLRIYNIDQKTLIQTVKLQDCQTIDSMNLIVKTRDFSQIYDQKEPPLDDYIIFLKTYKENGIKILKFIGSDVEFYSMPMHNYWTPGQGISFFISADEKVYSINNHFSRKLSVISLN